MTNKEIKIPNIGEFKDVEIIEVLIDKGQPIKKNDPVVTIESDKSSIEIPSTLSGKSESVEVKGGDKISNGDVWLSMVLSESNIDNKQIPTENESMIKQEKASCKKKRQEY